MNKNNNKNKINYTQALVTLMIFAGAGVMNGCGESLERTDISRAHSSAHEAMCVQYQIAIHNLNKLRQPTTKLPEVGPSANGLADFFEFDKNGDLVDHSDSAASASSEGATPAGANASASSASSSEYESGANRASVNPDSKYPYFPGLAGQRLEEALQKSIRGKGGANSLDPGQFRDFPAPDWNALGRQKAKLATERSRSSIAMGPYFSQEELAVLEMAGAAAADKSDKLAKTPAGGADDGKGSPRTEAPKGPEFYKSDPSRDSEKGEDGATDGAINKAVRHMLYTQAAGKALAGSSGLDVAAQKLEAKASSSEMLDEKGVEFFDISSDSEEEPAEGGDFCPTIDLRAPDGTQAVSELVNTKVRKARKTIEKIQNAARSGLSRSSQKLKNRAAPASSGTDEDMLKVLEKIGEENAAYTKDVQDKLAQRNAQEVTQQEVAQRNAQQAEQAQQTTPNSRRVVAMGPFSQAELEALGQVEIRTGGVGEASSSSSSAHPISPAAASEADKRDVSVEGSSDTESIVVSGGPARFNDEGSARDREIAEVPATSSSGQGAAAESQSARDGSKSEGSSSEKSGSDEEGPALQSSRSGTAGSASEPSSESSDDETILEEIDETIPEEMNRMFRPIPVSQAKPKLENASEAPSGTGPSPAPAMSIRAAQVRKTREEEQRKANQIFKKAFIQEGDKQNQAELNSSSPASGAKSSGDTDPATANSSSSSSGATNPENAEASSSSLPEWAQEVIESMSARVTESASEVCQAVSDAVAAVSETLSNSTNWVRGLVQECLGQNHSDSEGEEENAPDSFNPQRDPSYGATAQPALPAYQQSGLENPGDSANSDNPENTTTGASAVLVGVPLENMAASAASSTGEVQSRGSAGVPTLGTYNTSQAPSSSWLENLRSWLTRDTTPSEIRSIFSPYPSYGSTGRAAQAALRADSVSAREAGSDRPYSRPGQPGNPPSLRGVSLPGAVLPSGRNPNPGSGPNPSPFVLRVSNNLGAPVATPEPERTPEPKYAIEPVSEELTEKGIIYSDLVNSDLDAVEEWYSSLTPQARKLVEATVLSDSRRYELQRALMSQNPQYIDLLNMVYRHCLESQKILAKAPK